MVVRIGLPRKGVRRPRGTKRRSFVSVVGGLAAMAASGSLIFSLWRLTSDLGWTAAFVISDGIWSHWEVWMAVTLALGALAVRLIRYGGTATPVEAPARMGGPPSGSAENANDRGERVAR